MNSGIKETITAYAIGRVAFLISWIPKLETPLHVLRYALYQIFSGAIAELITVTDNIMYLNIGDLRASRTETKTI